MPLWVILICGFITSGVLAFGIFNEATPVALVAILAAVSLAVTGLIPASLFAAAPVVGTTPALFGITLGGQSVPAPTSPVWSLGIASWSRVAKSITSAKA